MLGFCRIFFDDCHRAGIREIRVLSVMAAIAFILTPASIAGAAEDHWSAYHNDRYGSTIEGGGNRLSEKIMLQQRLSRLRRGKRMLLLFKVGGNGGQFEIAA